ncbi:conserved hypothetical protein [Streptomyces pristinaespiralis ATCC 25486]|uniref:Uncharacterized protein n=1 Tax=Streptomyces pristinaespiralis (strain ATCC 25486 / DSM 40338 / CBS 914.69 / JCM 4507 / KCC S-0507 / NBRC 13074 / NRRL 2958 / 5647) TaxID=457429 RepID=B5HIS9_STRE2|nr:conserved hypothetical protein [Streptomyces pristinaespiralis ATCC 25486]
MVTATCHQPVTVTTCSRIKGNVASMNDRAPAPGGLALIEALVNTLDIETGADRLDTPEGRARFGLAPDDLPAARELREALRAACLAHAGHGTGPSVLDDLLAGAPLRVAISPTGEAALRPAGPATLLTRVAEAIAAATGRQHLAPSQGMRGGGLPVGLL